jgi:CheY-like chemotaxis protein
LVSVDAVDAAPFVDALRQHGAAADTALVAIVPAGRRGGAELDRFATVHRLTRPLRRSRLVECLDAVSTEQSAALGLAGLGPAPPLAPPTEPAGSASIVAVAARPSTGGSTGAPRVLVADDYFANQRLVARLLERRGYIVEAVSDGQAAVEAVRDRHFDVVLMDCNMPVLDGYAATAQIRALELDRRIPILAMTANDSSEDRDACLRAGMDDYLVKPIQAAIVLAAIGRWAARECDVAPALAGTPGGPR